MRDDDQRFWQLEGAAVVFSFVVGIVLGVSIWIAAIASIASIGLLYLNSRFYHHG